MAWDFLELTQPALAAARAAEAICFGSLAQRSDTARATIQHLIAASPENALRFFDINLRPPFYSQSVSEESLNLANILKLNEDELPVLVNMLGLSGSPENQIQLLSSAFNLKLVALTRGPNGSLLFQKMGNTERWSECNSRPVKAVDTVGAGDAFAAALVLGLLHKLDIDEINSIANEVACFVCSQPGATPTLPPEFALRFAGISSYHPAKRIS